MPAVCSSTRTRLSSCGWARNIKLRRSPYTTFQCCSRQRRSRQRQLWILCGYLDSQPFRSRANSLPGSNRPIGPWPIRSLELSFPGANWPGNFLVMARYSHKGHDTIRYDITQNIAIRYDTIRYDTIQKCFTVCKNCMLSVTNYSYIVAAPPIFTALTRSFQVGHGPTADESSSPARQCPCELVLLR